MQSKITLGIRRDLPVELEANIVDKAKAAWDDGRVGLNKLYVQRRDYHCSVVVERFDELVSLTYQSHCFVMNQSGGTESRHGSQ